jgi:hypothetical protein
MKTAALNKVLDTTRVTGGERENLEHSLTKITRAGRDLTRAVEALNKQISLYKKTGKSTIELFLARDRMFRKAKALEIEKLDAERSLFIFDINQKIK